MPIGEAVDRFMQQWEATSESGGHASIQLSSGGGGSGLRLTDVLYPLARPLAPPMQRLALTQRCGAQVQREGSQGAHGTRAGVRW